MQSVQLGKALPGPVLTRPERFFLQSMGKQRFRILFCKVHTPTRFLCLWTSTVWHGDCGLLSSRCGLLLYCCPEGFWHHCSQQMFTYFTLSCPYPRLHMGVQVPSGSPRAQLPGLRLDRSSRPSAQASEQGPCA